MTLFSPFTKLAWLGTSQGQTVYHNINTTSRHDSPQGQYETKKWFQAVTVAVALNILSSAANPPEKAVSLPFSIIQQQQQSRLPGIYPILLIKENQKKKAAAGITGQKG